MSESAKGNERKLTAYERWELPHLEDVSPRDNVGSSLLLRKKEEEVIIEEVDEDSLVYEPLTASQLEEIRLAAYDEGYVEGLEEGHQTGFEKGDAQGQEEGHAKGLEQGHKEGYEAGFTQSVEEATEKLAVVEALLNQLSQELQSPIETCKDQVESILYQSVASMVHSITQSQLTQVSESLLTSQIAFLSRELEELEQPIRIRLHSDSAKLIQTFSVFDRVRIKIENDDSLLPGGFVLDSKGAFVDASIEHKIELILNDLAKLQPHQESDLDGI
jgi:flagellar assembly protein FliH